MPDFLIKTIIKIMKIFQKTLLIFTLILTANCATNISRPKSDPIPAKVKFSNFSKIELKEVKISEGFASNKANKRAAKKIDEILTSELKQGFSNIEKINSGQDFSKNSSRTLQITPIIKEIKFISGAARVWTGALSGSSAILMEVEYRDSSNGKIIANPEFYRSVNAFVASLSFGIEDNDMLKNIAYDIAKYSTYNK